MCVCVCVCVCVFECVCETQASICYKQIELLDVVSSNFLNMYILEVRGIFDTSHILEILNILLTNFLIFFSSISAFLIFFPDRQIFMYQFLFYSCYSRSVGRQHLTHFFSPIIKMSFLAID